MDKQQLKTALQVGREGAKLPFSIHLFDTVSSTNQILWDLLNQGAEPGCTVIATQQTAGKGQWGRQWLSNDGGLYLSVAIALSDAAKPNALKLNVTNGYQLTLATAWGIARQLQESGVPTQIKWPNDLVLNCRKLGGILTETKVKQGRIEQAIIGVGINWANPVPETGINLKTWQALNNSQSIPTLEILAANVLIGIESGIQCLLAEGANILISRYLELLSNMGDRIHHNDIAGTIVGVTHEGALRVRMETGEFVTVRSREICFQPGTISLGYNANG